MGDCDMSESKEEAPMIREPKLEYFGPSTPIHATALCSVADRPVSKILRSSGKLPKVFNTTSASKGEDEGFEGFEGEEGGFAGFKGEVRAGFAEKTVLRARQALTGYTLEFSGCMLLKKWQALTGYTLEFSGCMLLKKWSAQVRAEFAEEIVVRARKEGNSFAFSFEAFEAPFLRPPAFEAFKGALGRLSRLIWKQFPFRHRVCLQASVCWRAEADFVDRFSQVQHVDTLVD
ncbi:hypothetical protein AK812_SmicGene9880 [Symbiodinium microadriaticum]|uniref:Uncharacterized protein n=1 Tax=Symbiodinium microadriaticum TaxID=2951 RepID=A0A1Q9EH93_SYMMI|nr:hypothetical protein AK812_SmicGene9880 [Symbiodinium microadriaticum]